jgi:phenylpropionate dioxygenase-like ring-hydroxylating dioxygenase large terminal subunit
MTFLMNAWYAVGHAEELVEDPIGIIVCGEPVVLFRTAAGKPAALQDRCPHRFVKLSAGKLVPEGIQCPYHGLRFDAAGQCALNPHGPVVSGLHVRAYPLVERFTFLWIWMGDPSRAEEDAIPDFSVMDDPTYRYIRGATPVAAAYQLIVDNLLDLSHVEYLHPDFARGDGFDNFETKVVKSGDTITAYLWKPNARVTNFQRMLWTSHSNEGDSRAHMRWDPPGIMLLDTGVTECGAPVEEGASFPSAHLVTPESETTSHYFWALGRNQKCDDDALQARLNEVGNRIFSTEDKPMIEMQQQALGDTADLMGRRPTILPVDSAAIRARRLVSQKIAAEQACMAPATDELVRS